MLRGIAELFVCGHGNRGCSGTDACIHQNFGCVYDGCSKCCEAILVPTKGVRHHDPDFSGYLQGLHDEVNAFMGEAILEDTMYSPILVEEFWYRENGEEHECTMRRFRLEIHDDVSKADKKGMGNTISGHCRNIGFVRRYDGA